VTRTTVRIIARRRRFGGPVDSGPGGPAHPLAAARLVDDLPSTTSDSLSTRAPTALACGVDRPHGRHAPARSTRARTRRRPDPGVWRVGAPCGGLFSAYRVARLSRPPIELGRLPTSGGGSGTQSTFPLRTGVVSPQDLVPGRRSCRCAPACRRRRGSSRSPAKAAEDRRTTSPRRAPRWRRRRCRGRCRGR
jgi:hypothetical protein